MHAYLNPLGLPISVGVPEACAAMRLLTHRPCCYAPPIALRVAIALLSAYPDHVQRLGIICSGSSYPRSEEQVGAAILGDT